MSYAFEYCCLFGEVLLSKDKQACSLIIYPDKKKVTLKTILLDLRLVLTATGFRNIQKAVSRESMINTIQPDGLKYYIWFIGVHPAHQCRGIGSRLLKDMIRHSEQQRRPICLETSTLKNVPWYQQAGFSIYHEKDLGYWLFFLKRNGELV